MARRSSSKPILLLFALMLFPIGAVSGQTAVDPADWIGILSPAGEVSIDVLEKNMLVDIDDNSYRVISFRDGFSIYVSMTKSSNAKAIFQLQTTHWPDIQKYKVFEAGDFLVMSNVDSSTGKPSANVLLASSRWSYSITVRAPEAMKAEFEHVLNSIYIGGKSMFKTSTSVTSAKTVKIDSLENSPLVAQALAQPDSDQVDFPKVSQTDDLAKPDDIIYSRPLFTIRQPRAPYTDAARSRKIQGTVKLRIPFLSSGRLGEIRVVSSVDKGLEKNALKVAKKIKFIPAQIDGKSVDVVKTLEYTFSIY